MRTLDTFTVISTEEAERRFAVSEHVPYDYADYADGQEQRLYEGGLHVTADLLSHPCTGLLPNMIVDGDLVLDGSIDWSGEKSGCYFFVTGNLRCKNLIMADSCFLVLGDAIVDNAIAGLQSDGDVSCIVVHGATRAKLVVSSCFPMHFGTRPDAIVCGDPEDYAYFGDDMPDEFAVDFDNSALGDVLVADVIDDDSGELDGHALTAALLAGRSILR